MPQVGAFDVGGRDVVLAYVEDGDDVRVTKPEHGLAFSAKQGAHGLGRLWPEDFNRGETVGDLVLAEPYLGHAAPTKEPGELIAAHDPLSKELVDLSLW
jgi:hypothetical protein